MNKNNTHVYILQTLLTKLLRHRSWSLKMDGLVVKSCGGVVPGMYSNDRGVLLMLYLLGAL